MSLRPSGRTAAAVSVIVITLTGCSSYSSGDVRDQPDAAVTCAEVLGSVVQRIRSDDTFGAIDSEFDYLASNCSTEYATATDYAGTRASVRKPGGSTCDSVSQFISEEALALLTEEGSCAGSPGSGVQAPSWADGAVNPPSWADDNFVAPSPAESQPGGGIAWNEAPSFVGTVQRVCGPLVGDGNPEDDVFLNLGLDYPSVGRFQIVIWDVGRIDPIPYGVTLCTTGQITVYDGVAQIELEDPRQVEIYG